MAPSQLTSCCQSSESKQRACRRRRQCAPLVRCRRGHGIVFTLQQQLGSRHKQDGCTQLSYSWRYRAASTTRPSIVLSSTLHCFSRVVGLDNNFWFCESKTTNTGTQACTKYEKHPNGLSWCSSITARFYMNRKSVGSMLRYGF